VNGQRNLLQNYHLFDVPAAKTPRGATGVQSAENQ
jgi:hypothetical protein